jgi:DNA-binding beta-propeller fold protein YncE
MRQVRKLGRSAAVVAVGTLLLGLMPASPAGAAVLGSLVQQPKCFDALNPACVTRASISEPTGVAVSPDGTNVYVVSSAVAVLTVFHRSAAGGLTYVECWGEAQGCTSANGMGNAYDVAVSPDGNRVYVAQPTAGSGGLVVFNRLGNGMLNQPNPGGCYTAAAAPPCTTESFLTGAIHLAVSPTSRQVYVLTNENRLVTMTRNATTGLLVKTDCESANAEGVVCPQVTPLAGVSDLAVSRDGKNVYTVANDETGSSLARYTRATNGALTYRDCRGTSGVCAPAAAIAGNPTSVAVSPNGTNVYVGTAGEVDGNGTVAVFNRSSLSTPPGALTLPTGTARCISNTGSSGQCADGHGLGDVVDLTVAPDNNTVYATAANFSESIVILRRSFTGTLTQPVGTAGCISDEFGANSCAHGIALYNVYGVATSPDGNSVYATALGGPGGLTQYTRISPPQTTITAGPSGQTTDRTPTFRFTSNEAHSSFQCKLDGRPYGSCTSPKTYDQLAFGRHVLKVRARDAVGTVDPTPATRAFKVIAP